MCDLIDLNSPDVKGLINSKLSSPLIPVPGNIESNEQASSLVTEKRECLGSNPFDNVLHETAEYVRKKGDPFEVMLQRALKYKSKKNTELKSQSVTFKDDFTPKRRKKFLKMMNKTLDESLIEVKFSSIDKKEKEGTVNLVKRNINVCDRNTIKERCTLDHTINRTASALSLKEGTSQSNSMKEEDSKPIMDNKLIDVDIFMLKQNFIKEHNKNTNSTSSSDSVFIDNSKFNKLILNEAKELSRFFEKMTVRTDSLSNTDDLLSNDTQWISELLPAFEEESTDNLIELPVSPKKNIKDDQNKDLSQSPASTDNAEEYFIKEIESQFDSCIPTVRQTLVTGLLSDLKKLVKAENNSEASKLIDNLESVLDVKYKNNTELLASLNISNELRTSGIFDDKLDNTEQSNNINIYINNSQEENKERSCNNESSLPHINHKLGDTSQAIIVTNDNSLTKNSPCNINEDSLNITISSKTVLNTNLTNKEDKEDSDINEQLAIQLLVNLEKLLSDQAEDIMTSQLLKSIRKTLNIAFSNRKSEEKSQMDSKSCNTQQYIALKTSESDHNMHLPATTETKQKQHFNSKFKPEKAIQGSISAIHLSNANMSSTKIKVKCKNTFSKASNTKIAEAAGLNSKNVKLLAINDVKNKLKKKSDIVGKRGPMKAVHPERNMQKKASLGKQTIPSSQVITSPKSNAIASFGSKIISSTPNSMISSTSDDQRDGTSKTQLKLKLTDKKRNFSCDSSPVTTQKGGSPRRSIQSPSAKICTPKRQQANSSSISKYCTPPRKLNSLFNMSSHQKSPQDLNKTSISYQRYSLIRTKSTEKIPQNLLKENNKFLTKLKPFKLISKLKGNTTNDFTENENCSR